METCYAQICAPLCLEVPAVDVAKAPDDYMLDALMLKRGAFVYPGLLTPEDILKLDS